MKMEVEEVAGAEAVALITASKLYICFISIFTQSNGANAQFSSTKNKMLGSPFPGKSTILELRQDYPAEVSTLRHEVHSVYTEVY